MTNQQQHPIIPPPELVREWRNSSRTSDMHFCLEHIATQAARWGADQELEACCEWFQEFYKTESWVDLDLRTFRAARRPKPPSLKKQALWALGPEPLPETGPTGDTILNAKAIERHRLVRRALEQLDD